MNADGVYIRARVLACNAWGLTPGQFERAAQAGDIAVEDVVELFLLESSRPFIGANVRPWMFRENEEKSRAKLAEVSVLVSRLREAKTPEEREAISQQLDAAQKRKG